LPKQQLLAVLWREHDMVYAEFRNMQSSGPTLPIGAVRRPRFAPHNQEGFNMAKHVSPATMRCPSLATKRISPQP
jgi:hypothetical protein